MSQAPSNPGLADQLRGVKVGLRRDLEISRQVLQGKPCYVLRDGISFQSHSLTAGDYQIILSLRTSRTVGEAFDELVEQGRLTLEREDEFYQFVVGLHQRGLLQLPTEDPDRLYARLQKTRSLSFSRSLMQLISMKLPLGNPDRWLISTLPFMRFVFARWFVALWGVAVVFAIAAVAADWGRFQQPWESLLAVRNVVLVLVSVLLLKVWHELGHALACRHFGGEVPEWGVILIVGTPCAYVDSSAAWGFHRASQRIIVNLAGMYFESLAAIVATAVWFATEPGLVHSAAHQTMIVSTVVTFFFNLNPLMKFDGYYVLSDWLGLPNLKQLADRAAVRTLKRAAFAWKSKPIGRTYWEQRGLVAFGISSAIYKVLVIAGLFAVIAYRLPIIGLIAAGSYVAASVMPWIVRTTLYLWTSPETESHRVRAITCWFALLVLPFSALIFPLSHKISAAGVVRPEQRSIVRAETTGFLEAFTVRAGDRVAVGDVLGTLSNSDTQVASLRAESDQLQESIRRRRGSSNAVSIEVTDAVMKLQAADARRVRSRREAERLTLNAEVSGVVTRVPAEERVGSFFHVGEPLLEIGSGSWHILTLLTAEQLADSSLQVGDSVAISVPTTGERIEGRLESIAPFGGAPLEIVELTHLAGGNIVVDPETMKPDQPYFELKLSVPEWPASLQRSGTHVDIALPTVTRPLASILYRRWLQFLDRFSKR